MFIFYQIINSAKKSMLIWSSKVQWNLDLVTLLVSRKTVTKSRVVTKFIAYAYGVSINSKYYAGTKVTYRIS